MVARTEGSERIPKEMVSAIILNQISAKLPIDLSTHINPACLHIQLAKHPQNTEYHKKLTTTSAFGT